VGNAATGQLQLDNYGHLLESASRLRQETGSLGPEAGALLAELADFVAVAWRRPDTGIWEVRDELHDFVQSKAMCWTALDRAARLAEAGAVPDRGATWRAAADEVRAWIETEGWSEEHGAYARAPDLPGETDASLVTLSLCAYRAPPSLASPRPSRPFARRSPPAARFCTAARAARGTRARSLPARSGSSTPSAAPGASKRVTP